MEEEVKGKVIKNNNIFLTTNDNESLLEEIKSITKDSSIKNITEINHEKYEKPTDYLINLDIFKDMPDSILLDILRTKKYIRNNHSILFHRYITKQPKENNQTNHGKIQSIFINPNFLKSKKRPNTNIKTRTFSTQNNHDDNNEFIYHKKNITDKKYRINRNVGSQTPTTMKTNTSYDRDSKMKKNFTNFSSFLKNLEESKQKTEIFGDCSLKEFLKNETKTLRETILTNSENVLKDEETKDTETNRRSLTERIEQKINQKLNFKNKNFVKCNSNRSNTFRKNQKKILTKSFNYLTINGNFFDLKRNPGLNKVKDINMKYKIFLNTQNFYSQSKSDYDTFRKNNITFNKSLIAQKAKKEKTIPYKLNPSSSERKKIEKKLEFNNYGNSREMRGRIYTKTFNGLSGSNSKIKRGYKELYINSHKLK